MMQPLLKTLDRTRRFLVESLAWRGMERPYALLAWALLGGIVWLVTDAASDPRPDWLLMPGELVLFAILASICAIDARFGIIPDSLVLALAAAGLLQTAIAALADGTLSFAPAWPDAGMAAYLEALSWRGGETALVFAVAALLRGSYRALRGRDGLGFGDVKLVTAAVLWTGLSGLPFILLAAVLSAAGSIAILRGEEAELRGSDAIAFGPHLAVGIWLTVVAAAGTAHN